MMLATNESHTREPTYDNAQYKISNWPFFKEIVTVHSNVFGKPLTIYSPFLFVCIFVFYQQLVKLKSTYFDGILSHVSKVTI